MSKKDVVLERMLDYLEHAKNLLVKDRSLQVTIFAHLGDKIIILPMLQDEEEPEGASLDLISKVICAYDIKEYFAVSESYKLISAGDKTELLECINILYRGGSVGRRIVSSVFNRVASGEMFFGETVELKPKNVEGSINELFLLKERSPYLTAKDKEYIRLLFPAQTEDDLDHEYILH